jgi:hypothetical protein
MSITRKLIDLAKSNLNALLERAAETVDPRRKLADVTDAELEAELTRRKAARATEQRISEAKARVGGDRAERERAARERYERVKTERDARQRARAGAAGVGGQGQGGAAPPPRSSSGPGPGAGPRPRSAPPPSASRDPELKKYYERLEIPNGSDFETVKGAYRRLMRRYHPDLHANKSPEKQRAANEVSAALTQAYNELEKALKGGPNRS